MSNWDGGVFDPGSYAGYVHRQQMGDARAAPHHPSDGGTVLTVARTVLVAAAPVGLVQEHADMLQAAVDLVPTSWREVEPVPLVRLGLVLLMLPPLWPVAFAVGEVRRRGARALSGGLPVRFLRWVWTAATTFVRGLVRVLRSSWASRCTCCSPGRSTSPSHSGRGRCRLSTDCWSRFP